MPCGPSIGARVCGLRRRGRGVRLGHAKIGRAGPRRACYDVAIVPRASNRTTWRAEKRARMSDRWNAFLVGLVVLIGVGTALAFVAVTRKSALNDGNSNAYHAYFDDVGGLNAKSQVQIAGLAVGEIVDIRLEGLRARVEMRIRKDLALKSDAALKKESSGLLGAAALHLVPGEAEGPALKTGDEIKNVQTKGAIDRVLGQFEGIAGDLKSITGKVEEDIGGIAKDIRGITKELNRFVAGDENNPPLDDAYRLLTGEIRRVAVSIDKAVRQVNTLLGKNQVAAAGLMANLERITTSVDELMGKDAQGKNGDLRETVASVRQITTDLAEVTGQLKTMVGENEDGVADGVKDMKTTLAELNTSLASLSSVMGKVERGEGAVGKLLTDERIAMKVEDAVSGASDFVSGLTSMQAHVNIGTWYAFRKNRATTAFGLRLQPRDNKYYLLELVNDGGGLERVVTSDSEAGGLRTTRYQFDNSIRVSAMFARMFWDVLVLRAGIIESSGGVGADVVLWDGRFWLRSDLYNFGAPADEIPQTFEGTFLPRWRTMLRLQPIEHVVLMAGIDDVLNYGVDPTRAGFGLDYFMGVGLTFQDDDLRSVLPFIPSF